MNILQINSEMSWRGGEQQLAYLISNTPKEQNITYHVMGKVGSELERWCEKNKVIFTHAPLSGSLDFTTVRKISLYCKLHKIDIIHAQTSHAHILSLYSKVLGNNTLLIIHRRVSKRVKKGGLSQWKYSSKAINKIICVSENVMSNLKSGLEDDTRLELIYDSVDTSRLVSHSYDKGFRKRYSLPGSQFKILNTSALDSGKDLITFIDVAEKAILSGVDAIFLIAGKGEERESLESYVKEKKLHEKVFFLGFVEDIMDLYENVDLFLLTSRNEGLGSSILEAFFNKVPVVATNTGGIPELVINCETGLLRPVADVSGLCTAVNTLLADSQLREEVIKNAHALFLERHHVDSMVEQTVQSYKEALSPQ